MQPQLGSLLRRLRQSRRLSQAQAAQAAGIGRVTLNRWETGTHRPRVLDLESLLSVLEASTKDRQQIRAILNTPQVRAQIRDTIKRVGQQRGIGPMPRGGDLLRVLRMRQGFTQEETAKRIGVTVRTLRRWEKGEVWPSSTQVQTLCYVLEAQTEEILALAKGPLSDKVELEIVSLDEVKERSHALHFYTKYWQEGALKELSFLQMEAQAWPQVARSGTGQEVLAELYSYHAYHLACYDRFSESSVYSDWALNLLAGAAPTRSLVLAALTAAHAAVHRGMRPMPQRGLEMLRPWMGAVPWPEYEAWLLSDIATYTAQCGDVESALRLSKRARAIGALCGNRHELYNRELDEAQLLLSAGMPGQVLTLIQQNRDKISRNQRAKFLLLETEAYLALGKTASAHDRLQEASQFIEGWALVHLQAQAQELTMRF